MSVSGDESIRTWNWKTGTNTVIINGHTAPVRCVITLTDLYICSGSTDTNVMVWDYENG